MSVPVTVRYATRSLTRNRRRLLLSILGIGVGAAIGVICIACARGEQAMVKKAVALSGPGHLRIVPKGFLRDRDVDRRLPPVWPETLEKVRALPEVRVATPRARVQALLAMGTRTANVEMVGVDPRSEPRALRFVRSIDEGRYLRPADEGRTLLGRALADRLDVALGDEVVATAVGTGGDMRSAIFRIVGIVDTGSRDIDLSLCQVTLRDIASLRGVVAGAEAGPGGAPGRAQSAGKAAEAGEITMLVVQPEELKAVQRAVQGQLGPETEVVTYRDIAGELLAGTEVDAFFFNVMILVVMLVVLLGVASAQLAGVLERRRQCAVLNAIGMSAFAVARIQLVEALALSTASTLAAFGLAVPVVYYLATTGIDIASVGGQNVGGVLLEPVLRADMGLWIIPYTLTMTVGATLLASLYPAWFAARLDPVEALRVAQ